MISSEQESNVITDADAERRNIGWDVQNAGKNYFTLIITQAGSAIFSFASVWLGTRYLGAEGYGSVAAFLLASQLIQISVLWTCNALARFGVQEFVETGQISKTFWSRAAIFLLNLGLMLILSPLWLPPLSAWFKLPIETFTSVLLYFSFTALWMHIQFALQGAKLPRVQGFLTMLERVLIFLLLGILAVSGKLSWLTAFWAYILPPIGVSILGLRQLKPLLQFKFQIDLSLVKKILKFSLPIPLYWLLGYMALNNFDAIFILQFMTLGDLGVYSAAYQMNGLTMQMPMLAGSLVMPLFVTYLSENREREIKVVYFQEILPVLTLGLGVLCLVVSTFAYYLIPFILGENFAEVGVLLWIFIPASAMAVLIQAGFLPLLHSISNTYVQTVAVVVVAAFKITLNFLLIPKYGLIGCSWATVIAFGFSMLTYAILTNKVFKLNSMSGILMTLPSVLAAVCFTLSKNTAFSILAFFGSAAILLVIYRNYFSKGLQRLLGYVWKSKA